jgi:hypothetical protein
MSKAKRVQRQIFTEKSLWDLARKLSKRYTKLGKPVCGKTDGSSSWYFRNAVLERMKKDGVKIELLELTDCEIY